MRHRAICLLWVVVTGCGLKVAVNDNPPPLVSAEQLAPGTRVQVHSNLQGKVRGKLARVSADSIVVGSSEDVGELAFPAAAVQRVDMSVGSGSRKGRGALIGLLVGGAGGYIALLQACSNDCVGAWILLALPVGGALIGAGIGATVGSGIETERWQRVAWP